MNGLFCLFATQGTKSETRLPVRSPSHCLFRAGPGRTTPGMQAVFQAQVRCGRQRPGRVTQGAVAADRFPDALHLGLEHRRVDGLDPPGTPRRRGGLLVSGRTIGVREDYWCQGGLLVSGRTIGVREDYWCQGGLLVSGRTIGVREDYWCQGGLLVSGRTIGVREDYWCQGGLLVSGRTIGVREDYWCQGGLLVSGRTIGVREDYWCQGGLLVSVLFSPKKELTPIIRCHVVYDV